MSGNMSRKFYKTILTIEILSENEPWVRSIEDLSKDVIEGDYSGVISKEYSCELTPQEMATALQGQGSSSGFFMLDEDGNDLLEEDEPNHYAGCWCDRCKQRPGNDDDDEEQLIDEW